MARSSDFVFPLSLWHDRTLKASEIRRAVVVSLLYLVATTALLAMFYNHLLERLVAGSAPLLFVAEDTTLVNDAVPTMTAMLARWMLAMLGVNLVITVCLGLYLARRLGQPLMALKRSLRELAAGNLDVQLRASDTRDFAEVAEELELAVRAIREQIVKAQQQASLGDGETPADETIAVEDALQGCREALAYFKVENGHPGRKAA